MKNERLSQTVYIMKAFAIISVVMAHCRYQDSDFQRTSYILGTFGVPIFMVAGGLYFNNRKSIKDFWLGKAKRIVVPWIVWGAATYVLHCLDDRLLLSVKGYILWLLGFENWFYFVPVLLICYLLFFISVNKVYLIICVIITLISHSLTSYVGLDLPISEVQNPFNWIGFFAFGILISDKVKNYYPDRRERRKGLVVSGIATATVGILYFIISRCYDFKPNYWNSFSIGFEMISIVFCYFLGQQLCEYKKIADLLSGIGKNSYPIYFTHMQIGIALGDILCFSFWDKMSGVPFAFVVVIKAVIVVLICYAIFVIAANWILKLIKAKEFSWIIGL